MKNTGLKKITIAIILAIVACACHANKNTGKLESAQTANQTKKPININYGELIMRRSPDRIMIPVYLPEQDQKENSSFDILRSGYKKNKTTLYNNIVFYHKKTGDAHLLLKKKAMIQSFDLLEIKSVDKKSQKFWLYKIIEQDTNADKKLNHQDATIGYISDLSGKNLQQITPNNSKMLSWVILAGENSILIRIIKDSNQDKKFTKLDNTNFVRVNLKEPTIGKEIISQELEKEIKSYVIK